MLKNGLRDNSTNVAGSPFNALNWSSYLQAGSSTTNGGGLGFVGFANSFDSSFYFVTITPRSFINGVGSTVPYTSGVKSASGVNFIGAVSATYDWIALGRTD